MKSRAKPAVAVCLAGGLLLAALWIARASRATDTQSGSISVDGRTRTYLLHVPAGHDAAGKIPLVLVLHGATQSPESAERMSGMSELADREDFVAAYPSGTGRLSRVPTWNSGNCCGYALTNQVDDVGFIRALIDTIEGQYPIDPKRVYVTGISNGAMMSFRLACELSDKIAAVAPVEGAQNLDCRPAHPVSVIIFHGTSDHLVPFDGGSTPYQIGGRRTDTPVEDTVAFWVKEDGCASAPRHEESSEVHTTIYSGCKIGTGVALYAIQGGRHMWPGLAISGNNVPATDLMWSFFTQHPKP
jgi:polyhydroxybutyrate depolymerase